MSLVAVIDAVARHLTRVLDPTVSVGDIAPAGPSELPAVTVSIADAAQDLAGVGRVPRASRTGALATETVVDLADPVLTIGTETITLLSSDRLRLVIPVGPIVRADGTEGPPFAPADVQIADADGPYTLVSTPTAGRTAEIDPIEGEIIFGQPLPAAGDLTVTHRVGRWDVTVVRHSGSLVLVTTAATPAATSGLTRQVAAELEQPDPAFDVLEPTGWQATEPSTLTEAASSTTVHRHTLHYRFAFELEAPSLPPAGGVIRTIAIEGDTDGTTESYDVPINP